MCGLQSNPSPEVIQHQTSSIRIVAARRVKRYGKEGHTHDFEGVDGDGEFVELLLEHHPPLWDKISAHFGHLADREAPVEAGWLPPQGR